MQKRNNISLTHSPDKTIISFKFDSLNKNDFIENVNKSKFNKCIIFCDFNVYGLFKNKLKKITKKKYIKKLYATEKLKDIKNIPKIIEYLENIQTNKSDLVLIIGGGTVSDLIGFAAQYTCED